MDAYSNENWSIFIEQPTKKILLVKRFAFKGKSVMFTKKIKGFQVSFTAIKLRGYWYFEGIAKSINDNRKCYLSLSKDYMDTERPYAFFGEVTSSEVYRQSPHEPADHYFKQLPLNAIPMVAVKCKRGFEVLISNTPAFFDNYSNQTFDLMNKKVKLSSGDDGSIYKNGGFTINSDTIDRRKKELFRIEPYYHTVTKTLSHKINGIFFQSKVTNFGELRKLINLNISRHWSKDSITDLLGATFFSTAYMNLRANETGKSKYWVVPAIGYANKQYSRDAFWISMVLPKEYANYCFENEAAANKSFTGAERQLFTIVWAYRNFLNGMIVDTSQLRRILSIIEGQVKNGYYSGYSKNVRVDGCWQGQADLIAYEKDDAITNNQGLFVTALMCAEKLGIKPTVSIELARENYEKLFNPKIGALSMSLLKDTMLAVDALMGDLLAMVYLKKQLLPNDMVLQHYETMKRFAKTSFGFKFFCNADGSYLKQEQYDSPSFKSAIEKVVDGDYQCGGSWYLYDMHLLMAAYLHGANDAEDLMIWRTKLEYELGSSTHEFINTITGKPHQPNMGWNAGVYGLWSEVVKQGKASNRFFNEINNIGRDR